MMVYECCQERSWLAGQQPHLVQYVPQAVPFKTLFQWPPYFDHPPMPALFRIVNEQKPPIPPNVSPPLHDFLSQCFQKDANARPPARKRRKVPGGVAK